MNALRKHSLAPALFAVLLVAIPAAAQNGFDSPWWINAHLGQPGQLSVYNFDNNGGNYGCPVEYGDFNNDGFVDVVISPPLAESGPAGARTSCGECYIWFGNGSVSGQWDGSAPGPNARVQFYGAASNDYLGTELGAGDVNGDGIRDLLIGAPGANPLGRSNAGTLYVVLGGAWLTTAGSIDLQAGVPANVLRIYGRDAGDRCSQWMEAADLNGDGQAEIILGPDLGDGPTNAAQDTGEIVIVWGGQSLPAILDLANPGAISITTIYGRDAGDHLGACIHTGDVDGDGFRDLIMGAGLNRATNGLTGSGTGGADGPGNSRSNCGEAYVLWGSATLPLTATVDLNDTVGPIGSQVTTFIGADSGDYFGEELGAADMNGDGRQDIFVGAITADGPSNTRSASGEAYIIYGSPALRGQTYDMAALPIPGITVVWGAVAGDIAGDTVSEGDANGDSLGDFILGVPQDDPVTPAGVRNDAGSVFVIYGQGQKLPPSIDLLNPSEDVLFRWIQGNDSGDLSSYSMEVGDLDADGFSEVMTNAMTGDGFGNSHSNAGEVHCVSGRFLSRGILTVKNVPAAGNTVDLKLCAEAAANYVVAASAATAPPIATPYGDIHLALDPLFYFSVLTPAPYFTNMTGVLDASGRGTAHVNIPLGMPAGLRIYLAFVTYDGTNTILTISDTTALTFE